MPLTYFRLATVAIALFGAAGCTVKNTQVPPLSGISPIARICPPGAATARRSRVAAGRSAVGSAAEARVA
jgi:hypothetical protein